MLGRLLGRLLGSPWLHAWTVVNSERLHFSRGNLLVSVIIRFDSLYITSLELQFRERKALEVVI